MNELFDPERPRTLARAVSEQGEIALRVRERGEMVIHELLVNGTFAMDSADVSSEIALADAVVDGSARPPERVLVGGLGLGYTADRLLQRGVGELTVAEIEAPLIDWAREGITPQLARVAEDPRVALIHADVARVLADSPGNFDAIALDVDNGPDFLIHERNRSLYDPGPLAAAVRALRPGGTLAVWSERASDRLAERLSQVGTTDLIEVPVERDGHRIVYAIHRLRRSRLEQAQ